MAQVILYISLLIHNSLYAETAAFKIHISLSNVSLSITWIALGFCRQPYLTSIFHGKMVPLTASLSNLR